MQLQAYMEEARINAGQMLERLKAAAADLGQDLELDVSTVYRHARGTKKPSMEMQGLYLKASGDLVRFEDWFALHNDKSLGLPAKKRAKLESEAQAA